MGLPAWLRRWVGNRAARVAPVRRFRPALDLLEGRDVPAVVGYYDATFFEGVPSQVDPIVAAGHTPVKLYDLTAADLAGLDVLFVQNDFNDTYGAEYLARLESIQSAVAAGMTLVLHDRYVDGAESVLPGGAGFNVVRDFTDPDDVQVLDDSTLVTHGPGGAVTDATLDGGGSSSHGFAFAASLPAGARSILGTGAAGHVVTFSYQFGSGHVVYSTIPLDYFLTQPANPFSEVYAPNVVAYAVELRNHPPVAGAGTLTTNEDTAAGGRLPGSDPDGDSLNYVITAAPLHGTVTLVDAATGQYVYTPDPDFFGTDSFSYSAADSQGGTAAGVVTITVASVNDDPVAAADAATTDEDTPVAVPVLGNDADVEGQALAVVAVTPGAHGSAAINPDGTVTYTPAAHFHGTDTFTYTVSDGHGGAATAAVTVTVTPVNDAPVAAPDSLAVAEDAAASVAVLANDSDAEGDALTVTAVTQPAHGTVTLAGGVVTYTPAADYNGGDEFTYTVDDGHGGTATATVMVTVTPVNHAPTADAGPDAAADEGTAVAFASTAADVDGDALSYLWDFGDGATAAGPTAAHAYADDGVYTAVLTVTDGHGGVATDARTVTVRNVGPTADAGPDQAATEGNTVVLRGTFADPGTGDTHAASWTVRDSAGSVVATGAGTTVSFVPADNGVYTATFTVADDDGSSSTDTVRVTVANAPPTVTLAGPTTSKPGGAVSFTAAVTDPGAADTSTIAWRVTDESGRVVATGTGGQLSFSPTGRGRYTVTCTVTDDDGGTTTATAYLSVIPTGQLPPG